MKSSKYLLLLLPIALIVLTSGCIGGDTGGAVFGPGVAILNFEPDLSYVDVQEPVKFQIRIQNQGEAKAEYVVLRIYGIDPVEWDLDNSDGTGEDKVVDVGYLIPPSKEFGTQGEIYETEYYGLSPTLPLGIEKTYYPSIRAYYSYETTAMKQVSIVARDELVRLVQTGQPLPQGEDAIYSKGPLSVNVQTGKYIKARTDGIGYFFPITITITNTGNGVVSDITESPADFMGPFSPPEDYGVSMKVSLPDDRSLTFDESCLKYDDRFGSVYLWKGQTASITCRVNLEKAPLIKTDMSIGIDLIYPYYIDASTAITVRGSDLI
ncbi:MAG: hypothetical protein KKB03_02265 [Nanoarchaeota archaeon]|nr:hypothetical protein [Nanoarchaeota archaeon]MBU1135873.1 hypothetical protein [Nanoarchaeota archaeon]MBU2520043.1 hypothetical protein [Nanoarchaeota archaeon]